MALGGATIIYMIGNSLTIDCNPIAGLAMLAADFGRFIYPEYHTSGGNSLKSIAANANGADGLQGPKWDVGLPSRERALLTCQPLNTANSTLGEDVIAITMFNDLFFGASPLGKSYIYAAWFNTVSGSTNYQGSWAQSVVNDSATPTILARQYFDHLYAAMAALYPGKMLLIPIGEVLFAVDIAAKAGNLPGITKANDLYRDTIHMGTVGHFMAASTVIACVFRRKTQASPATVAYYQSLGGSSLTLTEALAAQIETIVWNTVTADSRTGVNS